MRRLKEATSTALDLSRHIGEPKLIRSLEHLERTIGIRKRWSGLSPQVYDGYGVPLAYVWDSISLQLQTALSTVLRLAYLSGDLDVIFAAKTVEDHFLLMSERIKYVEVVCRRKMHWA